MQAGGVDFRSVAQVHAKVMVVAELKARIDYRETAVGGGGGCCAYTPQRIWCV
jgi:hypothetical protein